MADDASAGDIGLSPGVFYLNPPGVLSAGQSAYHPEGGKVKEEDIPPSARTEFQENIRTQQSRTEAEERQYLQRRQAEAQRLREIEGQRPKIPTEKLVGPAPDAREYQKDSMAFASSMAMLGALMAKGGRMSGANALAAFGGALKGWQEGNLEAYTNAVDKWKHETERTIENNRQLMQKYQLVMDNYRLNIDQQRSAMEEIAVQNHDQMAYNVLKVGNMTAMAQLQDQRWNWTNGPKGLENTYNTLKLKNDTEVEKLKDLALQYGPYISQVDQFVHKDGTPWTNQEKMMAKQIVQNYSPGTLGNIKPEQDAYQTFIRENPNATSQERAQFLATTKPTRSLPAQNMQAFVNETRNTKGRDPTVSERMEFVASQAALTGAAKGFASGQEARKITSLNVAVSHLETMRELADALKNGNTRLFNRIAQEWAESTGNPAPTNFDEAKRFVGPEIVKALVQAGGGVTERQDMENSFARAAGPKQIYGAIDTAERFLSGQFQGLKKQYERTTHKTDFDEIMMEDQALGVFKRFTAPSPPISGPQSSEGGGGASGTTSGGVKWSVE